LERAGDILKELLKRRALSPAKAYMAFFRQWDDLVEDPLAAHIKPVDIKGHNLLLEADHPGWLQLLQFKENGLLKKIQVRYPELSIRAIRTRVSVKNSKPEARPTKREDAAGSGTPRSVMDEGLFNKLKNGELKESLIRLYRRVDGRGPPDSDP
jgi:hypothetical protein